MPGQTILLDLEARIAGTVIRPGAPGYDDARSVWNARIDRHPQAIVRCASADDVIATLAALKGIGLPVSVRSGGHDFAGKSVCDGIVIDLSAIDFVEVDPEHRRARVGPGVRWGRFDREAQRHGLATTGGTVSTVGIAGFTLGGGTGWLSRRFGHALDNLRAAEVVLVSGQRVRASADENPDLFWALRGGSGNFGIVTAFEYQLHEVGPKVLGGQIIYPWSAAHEVLRFFRDFMPSAPDALQCYPFTFTAPPIDPFPKQLHGKSAISLIPGWTGPITEGERVVDSLRNFGSPAVDTVGVLDYVALQQSFDAGLPKGLRWLSRAHYLNSLTDETIETVVTHTESIPGAYTSVYFEPYGGAVARIAPGATAFPHRHPAFGFHILAGWADRAQDETNFAWVNSFNQAMSKHVTGGVYVNLLSDDEAERVPAAYGENFFTLRDIKKRYDPENFLHSNQNIPT
ncbi:MAG TPA: FAD-binding oxidoreductase [Terriglobales bacterium]|nr:FAD-binding oxidoreductase [Terriglobales bacterium]